MRHIAAFERARVRIPPSTATTPARVVETCSRAVTSSDILAGAAAREKLSCCAGVRAPSIGAEKASTAIT